MYNAAEKLSDNSLLEYMKEKFDNVCQGTLEHLGTTVLEEFTREIRYNKLKFHDGIKNIFIATKE